MPSRLIAARASRVTHAVRTLRPLLTLVRGAWYSPFVAAVAESATAARTIVVAPRATLPRVVAVASEASARAVLP